MPAEHSPTRVVTDHHTPKGSRMLAYQSPDTKLVVAFRRVAPWAPAFATTSSTFGQCSASE